MKDTQLAHHLYWIIKNLGPIKPYDGFINEDISEEVLNEINALVTHVKINY